MNIVRCTNNDFFDKDTYATCPHCGAGQAEESKQVEIKKPRGLFSFFRGENTSEKKQNIEMINATDETVSMYSSNNSFDDNGGNNDVVDQERKDKNSNSENTYNFWDSNTFAQEFEPQKPSVASEYVPEITDTIKTAHNTVKQEEENPEGKSEGKIEEIQDSSLKDQLLEATGNDGKTFGYFSLNKPVSTTELENSSEVETNDSPATVSRTYNEPVVGWLVCVKGPAFGQSFNVYCGRNSIGRSATNRIVIPNDNHISREKHAYVLYEPKKRDFWLQPGDSNSLVYFNGDVVMSPAKLDYYSEIDIGESRFLLIPLCCESFSWEDFTE